MMTNWLSFVRRNRSTQLEAISNESKGIVELLNGGRPPWVNTRTNTHTSIKYLSNEWIKGTYSSAHNSEQSHTSRYFEPPYLLTVQRYELNATQMINIEGKKLTSVHDKIPLALNKHENNRHKIIATTITKQSKTSSFDFIYVKICIWLALILK